MLNNAIEEMFFDSSDKGHRPRLRQIVQTHLEQNLTLPIQENDNPNCLFTEVGDGLNRAIYILSDVAKHLVYGPHIEEYTKQRADEIYKETFFSDTRKLEIMDQQVETLKQIMSEFLSAAERIQSETRYRMPQVPSAPRDLGEIGMEDAPEEHDLNSPRSLINEEVADALGSPNTVDDQIETKINEYLNDVSLSTRGTGNYQCPYADKCKKGGVGKDDAIKVFVRNCDFRAHLLKHEKMFKCNAAGCPHKTGFGRKEHLKRHMKKIHNLDLL